MIETILSLIFTVTANIYNKCVIDMHWLLTESIFPFNPVIILKNIRLKRTAYFIWFFLKLNNEKSMHIFHKN